MMRKVSLRNEENLYIVNQTKGRLPRLPFEIIKDRILGKNYELSIAFVSKDRARNLNKKLRGKDYTANILSFPFDKNSGELIICPSEVKKQAGKFNKTEKQFLGFLVIHGMLHLKGLEHSDMMEMKQDKFSKE